MARINILVSEKEPIEVEKNALNQTTIKFGDDLEIYIENVQRANELLDELERILLPEEETRQWLQGEIEKLHEKIDNIEEELSQANEPQDPYAWRRDE